MGTGLFGNIRTGGEGTVYTSMVEGKLGVGFYVASRLPLIGTLTAPGEGLEQLRSMNGGE